MLTRAAYYFFCCCCWCYCCACGCLLGYVFFRYFFRKFNFICAQVVDIFEISLTHPAHTQPFVAVVVSVYKRGGGGRMWCGGLDNSSSTIPAARCLLSWQCPCCWLNAWNWCRCRFPHVDVYLCKFNFHTKRSMRVCVCVACGCMRVCEYYENSLYFARLPWFLLTLCCCRYCRVAKVFFPLLLFIRPDKWVDASSTPPPSTLIFLLSSRFLCRFIWLSLFLCRWNFIMMRP